MPNSEIAIALGDDGASFDIAVPGPELRLALPQQWPRDADLLAAPRKIAVEQYFLAHFAASSAGEVPQQVELRSLTSTRASDPDVGEYEELHVRLFAPAGMHFDPRHFVLHYDAIIHQVPNHFALAFITQDFQRGQLEAKDAAEVGVIRYDFAHDVTPPLTINAGAGSRWRGVGAVIALGFRHVLGGLDHLLFLLTLLLVAPLRAVGGHWSLFQGWRYTLRRFLGISVAFTAGHSLSLLLGTYALVPVPTQLIEVLIAISILVAALHAMRPLFSGREWLVAASFGTVHGLAFAESLRNLAGGPWTRALAVGGFNLGVEGAQLLAMAAALPLFLLSRWRGFHVLRLVAMVGVVLVASAWLLQRLHG